MALILCIETTTPLCSVALGRDGALVAQCELEDAGHMHAEKVNVFIADVMKQAGLALTALDAVAVGLGPGSYTGSRIGLSAAKGLCYALGKPIIGINTLHTLVETARSVQHGGGLPQWPMIDARRMEVFTQPHDANGDPVGAVEPLVIDADWAAREPITVFGDGADKATSIWATIPHIVHLKGMRPHASAMLPMAEKRLRDGTADDLAYLVPLYGKAANLTQPKKNVV